MSGYCDPSTLRCATKPAGKMNGEFCSSNSECISNNCVLNRMCYGTSKYGERCLDTMDCIEGGVCYMDENDLMHKYNHKCVSAGTGSFCTSDSDCDEDGSGMTCDTELKRCRMIDPCSNVTCNLNEECVMGNCNLKSSEYPYILTGSSFCRAGKDGCKNNIAFHCVYKPGHYMWEQTDCTDSGFCSIYKDELGNKIAGCVNWDQSYMCGLLWELDKARTANICTDDETGYYQSECRLDVNGWYLPFTFGEKVECGEGESCGRPSGSNLTNHDNVCR